MEDLDKLIARLTDRLEVDPELQMDVAQELRGHLEDSTAEFHKAGFTDDQAEAEAIKVLGDPDELSGQLWQANRNRLRIRGLLRWGARITLIPSAIGVIVWLLFSMGLSPSPLDEVPESWANDLTEEQMYILRGDPAATTPLERAKSITDRWPENPVYFGDYLTWVMSRKRPYDRYGLPDIAKVQRLLELLEKGEKLDPDNAFFNFMQAAVLIDSSSEVGEDDSLTYLVVDCEGKTKQKSCCTVTIQDEKIFQQGLEELRQGLAKPRFALPSIEMLGIRRAIFPEPRNIGDILRRTSIEISVIIPTLEYYRTLARSILGFALAEARKGSTDIALRLMQDVEQFANHTGANSSSLIELLIAQAIYEESMRNFAQICKVLGRDEQGLQFQTQADESRSFYNELRNRDRQGDNKTTREVGMYWSILMPGLPGYTMDFEPMRTAEQFFVNGIGLLMFLVGLTLLTLLMGGVTLLGLLRRKDKPVLMFVGWRRIGKICLWAIVLPIGIYAIYVRLITVGPGAFGMHAAVVRVILEMIFVSAVIGVLLVSMSYQAIRHRAIELGLTVPEPLTFRRRWIMWSLGCLLFLGVVVYLIAWWAGYISISPSRLSYGMNPLFVNELGAKRPSRFLPLIMVTLSVFVTVFVLAWMVREFIGLLNRRYNQFRRSLCRNIVPILAAAVIVVGIICGIVLNRAEAQAARRVTGDAMISLKAEIDRSDYKQLRDRFAARMTKADAGKTGANK